MSSCDIVHASKSCAVCGQDVSHQKRVKDRSGSYYCEPCWRNLSELASASQSALARPSTLRAKPDQPKTAAPSAHGNGEPELITPAPYVPRPEPVQPIRKTPPTGIRTSRAAWLTLGCAVVVGGVAIAALSIGQPRQPPHQRADDQAGRAVPAEHPSPSSITDDTASTPATSAQKADTTPTASGAATQESYERGLQLIKSGDADLIAKGAALLRQAADSGHAAAAFELGSMAFIGIGVEQDRTSGIALWAQSAERGDGRGAFNLGLACMNGDGVARDAEKAVDWFARGAALNDAASMSDLGRCYLNGTGTTKDEAKAMEWFQKAAKLGNNVATRNLGVMYAQGLGVEKNPQEAFRWFSRAADLGNADAMWNLALAYGAGEGVIENMAKGTEWARKSARLGNEDAKKFVAKADQLEAAGVRDAELKEVGAVLDKYLEAKRDFDALYDECLELNQQFEAAAAKGNAGAAERLHQRYNEKANEFRTASAGLKHATTAVARQDRAVVLELIDANLRNAQIPPDVADALRELRKAFRG